jgi:hypothetical protein
MERMSRYVLIFISIVTSAVILPKLYWLAFEKPLKVPFVMYSCTDNDFMIFNTEQNTQTDSRGNTYSREEYEQKLPLFYAKQLLVSGTMPDSINGVAIDMFDLSKAKSNFTYNPRFMNSPASELNPLYESESGRVSIEIAEDYFRINWRIEFINASTNQINEEKSQIFSAALYRKGFDFPAKSISGLVTRIKSCDEGYFIVDSSDQLFHLKMTEGKPYVRKIEIPKDLRFKFISCVDFKDKKYYAYLFSDKNEIYILTQDLYELIKLPIEGFDPDNCELRIFGDLFHYHVAVQSENHLKVDVLNYSDYQKITTYEYDWLKRSELSTGKIAATIFPAQISMSKENSKFTGFYFERSVGYLWIFVNLTFALLHILILIRQKAQLRRNIPDLLVVTIGGIFGFIAVNTFPNKFTR